MKSWREELKELEQKYKHLNIVGKTEDESIKLLNALFKDLYDIQFLRSTLKRLRN